MSIIATNLTKFNYQKAIGFLREYAIKSVDEITDAFIKELKSEVKWSVARESMEVEKLEMDIEEQKGLIIQNIESNAWVIIDTFGTGEKSATTQEIWNEYKSSPYFNPLRKDKQIVGRGEGYYTNMFGDRAYSSGRRPGSKVGGYQVEPSGALVSAEYWVRTQHLVIGGDWVLEQVAKRLNECIEVI